MPLAPLDDYIGLMHIPDPTETIRKSIASAIDLAGAQRQASLFPLQQQQASAQAQQQQIQADQAQQQQQLQQQFMQDAASLPATPTSHDIASLMNRHPLVSGPAIDALKGSYDRMAPQEQSAYLSMLTQKHAALLQGQPDVAKTISDRLAASYEGSGMADKAASERANGQLITTNPTGALLGTAAAIIAATDPKDYAAKFAKLGGVQDELRKGTADADKAAADAKKAGVDAGVAQQFAVPQAQATLDSTKATTDNTRSEITARTSATALEQKKFDEAKEKDKAEIQKLNRESLDLPPDANKIASEAADSIQEARTTAAKAGNLASFFEKADKEGASSGVGLKALQAGQRFFGSEDGRSAILQQTAQLVNSNVLQQLKGAGRITQTEIETIKAGVPEVTANPKVVATFLRTVEKAQNEAADYNRAKVQWVSANRSMGAATRDFSVGGNPVKVGDTFGDYLSGLKPAPTEEPAASSAAGAPLTPDQVQRARAYLAHPGADPAKAALLRAMLGKAGGA